MVRMERIRRCDIMGLFDVRLLVRGRRFAVSEDCVGEVERLI